MDDEDKKELELRYRKISSVLENYPRANLVAVSKRQPVEKVAFLAALGHKDFGENYLQEWEGKVGQLPTQCRWHFIGQCQSRKVKSMVSGGIFGIHSIGSESSLKRVLPLVNELDGPVFLQVNLAEEAQKGGLNRDDLGRLMQLHDLSLFAGLMTIPPSSFSRGELTSHFREMRKLNTELGFDQLSMGMSSDWELALDEGATHIRVGSALFGARSA